MSSVVISGDTSGAITLAAPAVSGTNTLTLPAVTGNILTDKSVGVVLQVVNATYSTSVTSSTNTYVDTGLTATITPKFATSKILVEVHQNGVSKSTNDTAANIQLLRGASVISYFSGYAGQTGSAASSGVGSVSISYLDSPATTSATTYKTQLSSVSNNAIAGVQQVSATSTITLMEVAG
jgi:hypothetical protein